MTIRRRRRHCRSSLFRARQHRQDSAASDTSIADFEQSRRQRKTSGKTAIEGQITNSCHRRRSQRSACLQRRWRSRRLRSCSQKRNIIIGAHYDHLGRGGDGSGSLAASSGEIHHGADDNASGTAGLIELARVLVLNVLDQNEQSFSWRSVVKKKDCLDQTTTSIIRYSAANTLAMINMDMIGRMKDRKLIIGGVGTAKEWRDIISRQ